MRAAQADAFPHQLTQDFRVVALNGGMSRPAIRINQHRIRAVEGARFLRPAVGIDDGWYSGDFVQTVLKQQTSRAKLMFSWPVARFAGDQDDSLVRSEHGETQTRHANGQYPSQSFHF